CVSGSRRGEPMLRATFFGHHCWLFSGEKARIFVDPLLQARFGFTDATELRVYPPRRIDLEAFPAIDAVLITHEHEGHLDPASLNLIDRRVPVYLPARSSMATRTFLQEMGFEVRLMHPGRRFSVGDLEVLPMSGDPVN